MIRVAAESGWRSARTTFRLDGWAIESRLYAEDPFRNFLPSIERLSRYRPPVEGRRADATVVRNDTGLRGWRDLDVLRSDDRQAVRLGRRTGWPPSTP